MSVWEKCVGFLKGELSPAEFNTWILPLQAIEEGRRVRLFAPNRFVKDWVHKSYQDRILEVCARLSQGEVEELTFEIGSLRRGDVGDVVMAKIWMRCARASMRGRSLNCPTGQNCQAMSNRDAEPIPPPMHMHLSLIHI